MLLVIITMRYTNNYQMAFVTSPKSIDENWQINIQTRV